VSPLVITSVSIGGKNSADLLTNFVEMGSRLRWIGGLAAVIQWSARLIGLRIRTTHICELLLLTE
jgi:hypothetical protein